jgi:hypothetical protein
MGLGSLTRLDVLGQIGHTNSGAHVITRPRGLELDLVELFDARHPLYRTVIRPFQTWRHRSLRSAFRRVGF